MKRTLLKRAATQLVALASVTLLCSVAALAQDAGAPAQDQPAAHAQGSRSDGEIEMDVVHGLDASRELKNDLITAATIRGEVTLSGTVSSDGSKKLAEYIASQVDGVTKVHNKLTVGNPQEAQAMQPAPDPDSQEMPDADQSQAQRGTAGLPPPGPAPKEDPNQTQSAPEAPYSPQAPYPPEQTGPEQPPQAPYPPEQTGPQEPYPQQPNPQQEPYPQQGGGYPQQPPYPPPYPQPGGGYPQQPPYPPPYPQPGGGYPPPRPPYQNPQYGQYPPPYPPQGQYPPQSAPAYRAAKGPVTLLQGTLLQLRTSQALDSKRATNGTPVQFVVIQDIAVGGVLAIPRGAVVHGVVTESRNVGSGDLSGSSVLALALTSLDLGGRDYPVDSDQFRVKGPGKGGQTVGSAVGGGMLGTIIGCAAGGGAGCAIGAVSGVAAGTAAGAASPGPRAWIPAEALVTFHLTSPLTVDPVSPQEAARLVQGLYPGGPMLYRRPYYPYGPYYAYPPVYYRPYYMAGGYYYWR